MCIQIQLKVCIFQDESIFNLIYVTLRKQFFGPKKNFFDIQSKKKFLKIEESFINSNKFCLM